MHDFQISNGNVLHECKFSNFSVILTNNEVIENCTREMSKNFAIAEEIFSQIGGFHKKAEMIVDVTIIC